MQLSNLFSLSYWLDPSVVEQQAGPAMWLVVAAGLAWFGFGLVLARRSPRVPRNVASAQMIAGLLAAAVAIGRLFAIPVLGLRVGLADRRGDRSLRRSSPSPRDKPGTTGCRATAPVPWHSSARPRQTADWRPGTTLAWLALHLIGLSAVMVVLRLPLWLGPALIAVILSPYIISLFARRIPNPQSPISTLQSPISTISTLHAPRSNCPPSRPWCWCMPSWPRGSQWA